MDICLAELHFGYNFIDIHLDREKYIYSDTEQKNSLYLRRYIFVLLQDKRNSLELAENMISEFYLNDKLFHLLSKLQNKPMNIYLEILKMMIVQGCRIMLINNSIPLVHDYKEFYLNKWKQVCDYEFINKERCFRNMLLLSKRYGEWIEIQFVEFYKLRAQIFSKRIINHYQNIINFLLIQNKNSVSTERFIMENMDLLKYVINNKYFKRNLWNYLYTYDINISLFYECMKLKFGNDLYRDRYEDRNCYPQIYIPRQLTNTEVSNKCYICMDNFSNYEHVIRCRTCLESISHIDCSEKFGKCGFCRRKFRLHFLYFRD